MSTRSTILGKMWGEMLWVCWGMGEIMDELKVLSYTYVSKKNNNSHESNQLLLLFSSLVTGDCILVRLRCYNPKNFQVYISSIHIDFGIESFVQNHCYGSFSVPHNSHASMA